MIKNRFLEPDVLKFVVFLILLPLKKGIIDKVKVFPQSL